MSEADYLKIYALQDKVLSFLIPLLQDFYLTGGTALGRYYMNHRYSEDLDFFVNQNPNFGIFIDDISINIQKVFNLDETRTMKRDSFARITIVESAVSLKIEFVNDIAARCGSPCVLQDNLRVDNLFNILTNKFSALVSRDEPKDVFDIISIADRYQLNWQEIYREIFKKHLTNEADIAWRLSTFPPEWLAGKPWLKEPVKTDEIREKLKIISDDFLFARDNSLGKGKIPITEAQPLTNVQ